MKQKVLIGLTILWMIVIFAFSSQPATDSMSVSHRVGLCIGRIFVPNFNDFREEKQMMFAEKIDFAVRKTAHGLEYAMLGSLIFLTFVFSKIHRLKSFFASLICSIAYACTDEIHQLFVPGRSGQIRDVGIDSVGALAGIICVSVILFFSFNMHFRDS